MAFVLFDLGADALLEAYFNNTWPTSKDLTLKLFVNDIALTQATVVGDFTEAVGGGYAAKTLTNGSWTVTPANDPSDAIYAEQSFVFTGALTTNTDVFGYYIVNDDGVAIGGELLTVEYTPTTSGDELNITPKIQASSGTPA